MLLNFGSIELFILGLTSLLLWGGVITFVVFVVRPLLRKADQGRTIATLVDENQRLRDALAEQRRRVGLVRIFHPPCGN